MYRDNGKENTSHFFEGLGLGIEGEGFSLGFWGSGLMA